MKQFTSTVGIAAHVTMGEGDIKSKYEQRRRCWPSSAFGWSFMYSPSEALISANFVLVGLNPGGNEEKDSGWDYRDGENAYTCQPWGKDGKLNRLQRQVCAVIDLLG